MDLLAKIDEKREQAIHWESLEKDAKIQSLQIREGMLDLYEELRVILGN